MVSKYGHSVMLKYSTPVTSVIIWVMLVNLQKIIYKYKLNRKEG